jgi:hypothetical protein
MMMNFDMLYVNKDMQLWLSSYVIMGFVCGTPMLPKSEECHIACLVTCETTIYFALLT